MVEIHRFCVNMVLRMHTKSSNAILTFFSPPMLSNCETDLRLREIANVRVWVGVCFGWVLFCFYLTCVTESG